jgi:hypothetical protein
MTRETITPEVAETYLGRNRRNRHLRSATVTRYARDMANGEWLYTGEAIKFDADGNLLDGQHRLHAIVEADCPIELEVIRELDAKTQDLMDTGMKRSHADMLALHGYTNVNNLAAVARLALRVENGSIYGNRFSPTQAEIREWVEENPEAADSVEIGRKYAMRGDCRPAIGGYTHYVLSRMDKEAADRFWIGVGTKVGLEEGDPRLVLSQRFADLRRNNVRVADADALSLIYRAWNHWRDGHKMQFLRNQTDGGGRVAIPRPH